MADYTNLKDRASEIRTEVKVGANTAQRVGYLLEQIVTALESNDSDNLLENVKKLLPKMYSEDMNADTVLIETADGAYIKLAGEKLYLCSMGEEVEVSNLIPTTITKAEEEARKKDGVWDVFVKANPLIYVTEG
jgi:hypothetical protein